MVYYKMLFYPNVYDTTKCVVLANQPEYVPKDELLHNYKHLINSEDIGEHSYIIEYMTTSLDSVEKVETLRIKVA
jgi:hypothetical protein